MDFHHIKTKRDVKKGKVHKSLKQQIYMLIHDVVKLDVVISHFNLSHVKLFYYTLSCLECKYQFHKLQVTKTAEAHLTSQLIYFIISNHSLPVRIFVMMTFFLSAYTIKNTTQTRDWMQLYKLAVAKLYLRKK